MTLASLFLRAAVLLSVAPALQAQVTSGGARDPNQTQDTSFARVYREWLPNPRLGSPLVDHLPIVPGVPTPRDVLGYHIGRPKTLTYYADQLRYYRALAAATPRVRIETIGRSDEDRELVVVWVSSEANLAKLDQNRANLAMIADPRGKTDAQIADLIRTTVPHYHLMGGLHSGETGPSEMLMELVYRLATETSPIISNIRNNLIVSITPAADADGRDRNVDWFYRNLEQKLESPQTPPTTTEAADTAFMRARARKMIPPVPYWGKYAYHDNNRDINLVLMQMRALGDWYFTAHPPIMHDLHESLPLLYTYSGGAPQNPNLDPLLFTELPWFANWELSQMTRYGMPGVYTHAFMDGWSPGYLGSLAYNHNGMMKMYETNSGRDLDSARVADILNPPKPKPDSRQEGLDRQGHAGRGRACNGDHGPSRRGPHRTGRRPGPRVVSRHSDRSQGLGALHPTGQCQLHADRRDLRAAARGHVPTDSPGELLHPNQEQHRGWPHQAAVRLRDSRPARHDPRRRAGEHPPHPADRSRRRNEAGESGRLDVCGGLVRHQARPAVRPAREESPGEAELSRFAAHHLRRQRLDHGSGPECSRRRSGRLERSWRCPSTAVDKARAAGRVAGNGTAGIAIAHLGSNNMISLRYRLRDVAMQVAEKSFTAEGIEFPAGSFVIPGTASSAAIQSAVEALGLTAVALKELPSVPKHDADLPRIAIYSQWGGTQSLGWYRLTFDAFGVPFELIYKEQVVAGNLRSKYDVILMAEQNLSRTNVMLQPNEKPVPYQKNDKYKFLGMYGETADMTGGFGQPGVDAFAAFLEGGGTMIAIGDAARLPIEFGWAGTVEKATVGGLTAQRPAGRGRDRARTEHPGVLRVPAGKLPIKYVGGQPLRVGVADEENVLARYVGGDASVLSGLMTGADSLKRRPFVVDVPEAYRGKGRVILFANNPIYRWQNHGEFNMVFNSIINWNDLPRKEEAKAAAASP